MNFAEFLRRAKSSLKFWAAAESAGVPPPEFHIDEVAERVAKLKVPEAKEPVRMHALVKLAPIPVPREVRWESQAVYFGAWAGTALLAWGSFYVPANWLIWYGAAAIVIFALLFRMEGPRTKAERLQREAQVKRSHAAYVAAEAHLQMVLKERFNERVDDFNAMRVLYDQACLALDSVESSSSSKLVAALSNPLRTEKSKEEELAEQVSELEQRMMALVNELEDFSDVHKEAIDAAIMERHNARLAYWQAKLDEAALTGEAVQQH